MAIKGVSKQPVPYIPEIERGAKENQTIFWIKPKTGHQANQSIARYASARKDGRKGTTDLNVGKLDGADQAEFLDLISMVENYEFSDHYPELAKHGIIEKIDTPDQLVLVAKDLPSDILNEIFDASNNMIQLKEGEKKS